MIDVDNVISWIRRFSGRTVSAEDVEYKPIIGYNLAVGATGEGMWPIGGPFNRPIDQGVQVEAISSSALDDVGGTGLITGRLEYLDVDWVARTFDGTMDGLAASEFTPTDIRRVNDFYGLTFGALGVSGGAIDIREATTGAPIYTSLLTGSRGAASSHRTIAQDTVGLIFGWRASVATVDSAIFVLEHSYDTLNPSTRLSTPRAVASLRPVGGASAQIEFPVPIYLPWRTDVDVIATRLAGGAVCEVCVDLAIVRLPTDE